MTFVTVDHFDNSQNNQIGWLRNIQNAISSLLGRVAELASCVSQLTQWRGQDQAAATTRHEEISSALQALSRATEQRLAQLLLRDAHSPTPDDPGARAASRTFHQILPTGSQFNQIFTGQLNGVTDQINAFHLNMLQWLQELDNKATSISRQQSQLARDAHNHHESTQAQLASTAQSIASLATHEDCRTISATLDRLAAELAQAATSIPSNPPPPPSRPTTPAITTLPTYVPHHPTAACRTNAFIECQDVRARIPFDWIGKPPDTSRSLCITVEGGATHTTCTFRILSAGVLQFSRTITTPHALTNLPADALALLHAHCPHFAYKLTGMC